MYPKQVNKTLMSNAPQQPFSMKTPRGGKKNAAMNLKISEQVKAMVEYKREQFYPIVDEAGPCRLFILTQYREDLPFVAQCTMIAMYKSGCGVGFFFS